MCSTPWPKGGVVVDYMHWQPEQVSLGGPPAAPETVFCFQHPPLASFHEPLNVKGGFFSLLKPEIVFFAASSAGMEPSIGGGQP